MSGHKAYLDGYTLGEDYVIVGTTSEKGFFFCMATAAAVTSIDDLADPTKTDVLDEVYQLFQILPVFTESSTKLPRVLRFVINIEYRSVILALKDLSFASYCNSQRLTKS